SQGPTGASTGAAEHGDREGSARAGSDRVRRLRAHGDRADLWTVQERRLRYGPGSLARRGQIELHAEVMLVGRKLPIENAPGRIGGRRQCLVGVLVVVEIFVQLEGDGFSWLPARAGHGDDLARGVLLLVCLHGGGRVPVRSE